MDGRRIFKTGEELKNLTIVTLPIKIFILVLYIRKELPVEKGGTVICRAGNEPSYSGSARKNLGSGSARELNDPSLSLNLGLINLGLGSGSTSKKTRLGLPGPIRRWNKASAYGLRPVGSCLHWCDPDSGSPE